MAHRFDYYLMVLCTSDEKCFVPTDIIGFDAARDDGFILTGQPGLRLFDIIYFVKNNLEIYIKVFTIH